MTEFTPITTQEEFDERIKARLAREREKWEKSSGTEDLNAQLEAKNAELDDLRRSHWRENAERVIRKQLAESGISEEGRVQRTMKLVDFDALRSDERETDVSVRWHLAELAKDVPELLSPEKFRIGAGSGSGSKTPVLKPEKALTQEDVEKMSEAEINSRWDQVKGFLAGERG